MVMICIRTVSGLFTPSKQIFESVKTLFENDPQIDSIKPLEWQTEGSFRQLQDFLDSREVREIVLNLSMKLTKEFDNCNKIVIISASAGSLLIEEALSLLTDLFQESKVIHIMFAPAINGSNWATLGKLAKYGLMLLLTKGLLSGHQLGRLFFGIMGVKVLGSLSPWRETLLDHLQKSIHELNLQPADIGRHIVLGTRDIVVRDIPLLLPRSAYYKGNYTHSEVTDLSTLDLNQVYSILETGEKVTKKEIVRRAVYGSRT